MRNGHHWTWHVVISYYDKSCYFTHQKKKERKRMKKGQPNSVIPV